MAKRGKTRSTFRGKDPRREKVSRRVETRIIEADFEPRPSVRLITKYKGTKKGRQTLRRFANRVLEQVKENIRTGFGGRWTRIQYNYPGGPSEGDLALQGTENQWHIVMNSDRKARIRPKVAVSHIWRGHIFASVIRPRDPKGRLGPIKTAQGNIFVTQVKMPKRDPRPTRTQLLNMRSP